MTASKFNMFMSHELGGSGDVDVRMRVGNGSVDTGSNYAERFSHQGGTDITQTSQDDMHIFNTTTMEEIFHIGYGINISTEEKLFIQFAAFNDTTGAGTAPERFEHVHKWTNTSVQYDNVQMINISGGNFQIDSNLSALGTD